MLHAVVDSRTYGGPQQGLREHPGNTKNNPSKKKPFLLPSEPEEVAQRGSGVRRAGVNRWEFFIRQKWHKCRFSLEVETSWHVRRAASASIALQSSNATTAGFTLY